MVNRRALRVLAIRRNGKDPKSRILSKQIVILIQGIKHLRTPLHVLQIKNSVVANPLLLNWTHQKNYQIHQTKSYGTPASWKLNTKEKRWKIRSCPQKQLAKWIASWRTRYEKIQKKMVVIIDVRNTHRTNSNLNLTQKKTGYTHNNN